MRRPLAVLPHARGRLPHLSRENPQRHGHSSQNGLQSCGSSISAWPIPLIDARTATTATAISAHRAISRGTRYA